MRGRGKRKHKWRDHRMELMCIFIYQKIVPIKMAHIISAILPYYPHLSAIKKNLNY